MDIKTTKKNSKSNKSRDNICLRLASSCRFQWMSLGSDSPYSWWNCSKYALYLWIKLAFTFVFQSIWNRIKATIINKWSSRNDWVRIAITNPSVKIIWRRESQYLNPKVSSRSIKEREHNLDLSINLTWQPMNVLVNLIPAFFLLALRF